MSADYCYKFQGDGNTFSVIKAQWDSPGPFLLSAGSQWGLGQLSIKALKTKGRDWAKDRNIYI